MRPWIVEPDQAAIGSVRRRVPRVDAEDAGPGRVRVVVEPLEPVPARNVEPRMVVESEGRQLVVAVSIEFLDQGGKATVTPGGQLAHGKIRPAEKIEAALEKLAVHRVDVFLVPIRIAAGLLLTSAGPVVIHGGTEMLRSKGLAPDLGRDEEVVREVAWSAVEHFPPALARQVRRHERRYRAGIERGLQSPPAWRSAAQRGTGGLGS